MESIEKRDVQEHVFLVNCRGSHDTQSEAAYYPDAPFTNPETIAIVTFPDEGLRRWEDNTTTAIFQDAESDHQTSFTVTLGPRPKDGEIAGNATNTWNAPFNCYAQVPTFLYTREQRNCSGVYDCSRADRPPQGSTPNSTSSRLTAGSTSVISTSIISSATAPSNQSRLPSTTSTTSPSPLNPSHPQTKIAIGIGVGVTVGTLILAVTAIALLRKFWNERKSSGNSSEATSNLEPKIDQLDGRDICEAGSKAIPVELPGCNVHTHELEAKPRMT